MRWRTSNPITSRWRLLNVRTRLMAVHIVAMTIVIGAIVLQVNHVFTVRLTSEFNRDLTEEGPEFSNAALNRPAGQPLAEFASFYLNTHLQRTGQSLIISLDSASGTGGQQLMWSRHAGAIAADPAVKALLTRAAHRAQTMELTLDGSHYRAYATPIMLSGQRVGALVAVRDLAELSADQRSELTITALEGLAALVAAVLAGYLLLRRVLRVVSDVTDAAEHAASGNLSLRLPYGGPDDEVGRLARTVDEMLRRLDQAFTAQRRLLSDISHQLRTPLTVIRGHLEVLARNPEADLQEQAETVALVVDELDHMSLMIERLLLLGRAMEPDFIDEDPIDVNALLEDVVDAAQHLAPRYWELDAAEPLIISGDRTKLRGAVLNLVDNAVRVTSDKDTIRVSARRDDDENVVLEVADTGPGMPVADQQRLLERFARSTDRYRGSGLGLAIVKAVAEAHGGRIEIDSASGHGCRVRLILPGARVIRVNPLPQPVA
jgi:signal transduction histidine kinase